MNMVNEISLEDLSFLQLSDSFFPTGLYTTSNGLEALFYEGKLKKPKHLQDLIKTFLFQQIGPTDCTALGNVYDCIKSSDLAEILSTDQMIYSMKLIEEVREASVRSGIQLLRCVNSFVLGDTILDHYQRMVKNGEASGVYPVSFAVACNSLSITKYRAGLMLLYGFTITVVAAAIRLGIVQHLEGQKVIHNLKPSILSSVHSYIQKPLSSMWQFAPIIDITQIKHEQMDSKMFIT
jgi:urease accessory protein